MPVGIYIRTKPVWNKGKTKADFPQLSRSGRRSGFISPRKGVPHTEETRQLLSKIHKGKHLSPETEFKKTGISWRKTRTQYRNLHRWVTNNLGRPNHCEFCDKVVITKHIHWANKSGSYAKDLSDWLRLCAKCHFHYDLQKGRHYVG